MQWTGRRRAALELGLGGIAAAGLVPAGPGTGMAQAAVPVVDPVPRIVASGKQVELLDFAIPPSTRASAPRALLSFLHHAGDGTARVFANDSRGRIWELDRTTGATRLFLDLARWRGSALVLGLQLGLRSFAFHPNFARPGWNGYRRLYTLSVETVASRPAGIRVFEGSFPTKHDNVLAEWMVDAPSPGVVLRGSRREVLRIAQFGNEHGTDQIMFRPGERGLLYIGSGDSKNSPNNSDPYNVAQDPSSALGKILRINPLRQKDGRSYAVPAGNPFVGRSGYLPEIWALGLRHPQNYCFDAPTGKMILIDIGQAQIEEVNLGVRGANYGWPHREGTFAADRTNETILYPLPVDDSRFGYTYPVAQYDHDEGNSARKAAITGGFVYRGSTIPELVGEYLLGDIITGRIFHVPLADLQLGRQTPLKELTLYRGGVPVTLMTLAGVGDRVDLRFGQDELGEIYVLSKQDGMIRKLGRVAAP